MNNNLELIYWTNNGGVELPLEDWQYKVIAQVLGLSIEEHKKHTSNWQHGKPQKAYYDLEGLKIFYEDGKIWHYRPIDENTIEWW